MLYAFAHCVGSEALSAIGFVLLTTIGLKIVARGTESRRRDWLGFSFVLLLLMLTRQVNAALAVLLPCALLPLLFRKQAAGTDAATTSRGVPGLRPFLMAAAAGAVCFMISLGCVRLIALAADMPYRSKIGYTFMWRLKFLQALPPAERASIVSAAAARAASPESKRIIEALDLAFSGSEPPDVSEFLRAQRASFSRPAAHRWPRAPMTR